MAEVMTVEAIIEAYWQMQGYWTRTRYPIQTKKGGWSDIDILAYEPQTHVLVIAESKVRGPKTTVYAYTRNTKSKDIFDYDKQDNKQQYLGFLKHLKYICSGKKVFKRFDKMVSTVVVHLVSNYVLAKDIKPRAEEAIRKRYQKDLPKNVTLKIQLDSTLDLIAEIVTLENKSTQGRRYGHPALDIARELNRYMRPNVLYAGGGKEGSDMVKKELKERLRIALGI